MNLTPQVDGETAIKVREVVARYVKTRGKHIQFRYRLSRDDRERVLYIVDAQKVANEMGLKPIEVRAGYGKLVMMGMLLKERVVWRGDVTYVG